MNERSRDVMEELTDLRQVCEEMDKDRDALISKLNEATDIITHIVLNYAIRGKIDPDVFTEAFKIAMYELDGVINEKDLQAVIERI